MEKQRQYVPIYWIPNHLAEDPIKLAEIRPESPEWAKQDLHLFIVTDAGKPIYTRYGTIPTVSPIMCSWYAICSLMESLHEELDHFRAGSSSFVFLRKHSFIFIAVSKTAIPVSCLFKQLNYLYLLFLSLFSEAVLTQISQRPSIDFRLYSEPNRPTWNGVISNMSEDPAFIFVPSIPVLCVRPELRQLFSRSPTFSRLQSCKLSMLVKKNRVVAFGPHIFYADEIDRKSEDDDVDKNLSTQITELKNIIKPIQDENEQLKKENEFIKKKLNEIFKENEKLKLEQEKQMKEIIRINNELNILKYIQIKEKNKNNEEIDNSPPTQFSDGIQNFNISDQISKFSEEVTSASQVDEIEIKASEVEVKEIVDEEAEKQRLAKEEAEKQRLAKEEAEKQRLAKEEAEKQRLAKEEAEKQRLAKEEAEKQRLAKEEAEKQRLAKEEAEKQRLAKEEAEKQRLAKEEAEKQRLAKEEAEKQRLAKEEAEKQRLAKEEAEKQRLAKEEAEKQRLAKEEAEKQSKTAEPQIQYPPDGIFTPTKVDSFTGIFHYFRKITKNRTRHKVTVTSSSTYSPSYEPRYLLIYDDKEKSFALKNELNGWICFYFTVNKIIPSDYQIMSCDANKSNHVHLRNWVIEGSNNNSNWEILDSQNDCDYVNGRNISHVFHIKKENQKEYRYIRLKNTAKRANNLEICMFEIYGKLMDI